MDYIINAFQSIDLSDTVLLSQAQLLLWAVSIVFTYYIFRKQLKLTKDQISLTEWIFKVTQTRYEIDKLNDIISESTDDYNKCYNELLDTSISKERRDHLEKQIKVSSKAKEDSEIELISYIKEYENLLNQRHF